MPSKSTLLSVVSPQNPGLPDYPFTTLTPNLGIVNYRDNKSLSWRISRIIEGAHEGKDSGSDSSDI